MGGSVRHDRSDEGFTLIELMVVVMIIAVLLAVAIPTFLGFRSRAQDSAAQRSLNVAHKATYGLALEGSTFPSRATLVATMPGLEPSLTWVDHLVSSTGPKVISVDDDAAGMELALAARSHSGSCFYLRISLLSGVSRRVVPNAPTCMAHDYQDGADTGW